MNEYLVVISLKCKSQVYEVSVRVYAHEMTHMNWKKQSNVSEVISLPLSNVLKAHGNYQRHFYFRMK